MDHPLLCWDDIRANIEEHRRINGERGERFMKNAYLEELLRMNAALERGARVAMQVASTHSHSAPDEQDRRYAASPYRRPSLAPCLLVLKQIAVSSPHEPERPGKIIHHAYYVFWNETLLCFDTSASALSAHPRWSELRGQIEE